MSREAWMTIISDVVTCAPSSRTRDVVLYTVALGSAGSTHPFSRETFVRRADAERFIADVGADEPELAARLGIEEHVIEGIGALN
jgi:hypothetical protein